jgi:Na+-driven multidrug efflux pump
MPNLPSGERITFLYRSDQGRIDRATWRGGALGLLAVLLPATIVWLLLEPYTDHDLSKTPLWAPEIAAAYAYLIFYAFVVILIGASFVNLSVKRFRALGHPRPLALAGLLPLAMLFAGAAHFFQPRLADVAPRWYVYPFDLALIGVAAWTLYELAWRE